MPDDDLEVLRRTLQRRTRVMGAPGAHPARPAAVLVLLARRDAGLHLVFEQRPGGDGPHAGQICFPGGTSVATDLPTRPSERPKSLRPRPTGRGAA